MNEELRAKRMQMQLREGTAGLPARQEAMRLAVKSSKANRAYAKGAKGGLLTKVREEVRAALTIKEFFVIARFKGQDRRFTVKATDKYEAQRQVLKMPGLEVIVHLIIKEGGNAPG